MIKKLLDMREKICRSSFGQPPTLIVLVDPITEADVLIDKDFRPMPFERDGSIGTIYGMKVMVISHAQELCEVVIKP